MDLYLVKTNNGTFIPAYDSDHEAAKKIKSGEMVKGSITRPRNVGFHKKFFALLNLGFQNQEQYEDFESFRAVVIMKAGFYTKIATDRGAVYLPKSISFAKMDETEFEQVYDKVLDVIIAVIGVTKEDVEIEIVNFM